LSLRYDGIKMPVAVLSGDGDQIVRVDQSRRLHQKIPGSELHEIRHAGHMAHHLEPETIAAAIDAVERTGRVGRCSVLTAIRIRERARTLWKDAGRPSDGVATFRDVAASEIAGEELAYDKALADSFPASDPPANSGFTR
jgi:hypothetical protein